MAFFLAPADAGSAFTRPARPLRGAGAPLPTVRYPVLLQHRRPDGQIATLSRTASTGKLETETADDFTTSLPTNITDASFIGLLVGGATPADVKDVEIELYHVFPVDSTFPPDNRVITRVNSPSDNNFAAADGALGQLSFTTTALNPNFHAANSVVNGINPAPNQFTGGEGPVTGQEVQINVHFTKAFTLSANDHIFFRPEVDLGSAGNFLWLSAPKPILPAPLARARRSRIPRMTCKPGFALTARARCARLGADWHRCHPPGSVQCLLLIERYVVHDVARQPQPERGP